VAEQLRGEDGVKTACDALEALYAKSRQVLHVQSK
jgi:hypothetical protein